jgi:hypothetical protein
LSFEKIKGEKKSRTIMRFFFRRLAPSKPPEALTRFPVPRLMLAGELQARSEAVR